MAKRSRKKQRAPEVSAPVVQSGAGIAFPRIPGTMTLLHAALIIIAGLVIYWPAVHGDWLWDDYQLISLSPLVHDPNGLWKIWFEPGNLLDYFPLKVTVEWLEWQLWGNDTFGYHLVTLILHLVGSLLVWRLLNKFQLRYAWLGGLLFAVHPAMVESVAWISELKNTLSLPFFLLSVGAFIDYDERGNRRDFFLSIGLFLAAMLCKPSMVMFPFVILLYAWWKRGTVGLRDLKTSAPFFAVSLALGLITVWFLNHHVIGHQSIDLGSPLARFVLMGLSLAFYFSKFFLPIGLAPTYPRWEVDPSSPVQYLPWVVMIGMFVWFWWKRNGWGRHALLGVGFFLLNLAPFTGFTKGSYMQFTWVMDHFLYMPMIGLIGLVIAALGHLEEIGPRAARPCVIGIVAIVLVLCVWGSRDYASKYTDQITVSNYALQLNPRAIPAYQSLGYTYLNSGRVEEAMEQFQQVLRIDPEYSSAHHNLGIALMQKDRIPEAIEHFDRALKVDPDNPTTQANLAIALSKQGHASEAIEHYQVALRLNPNDASIHYNLALTLNGLGRSPEAVREFQEAIRLDPNNAAARHYLGNAFLQADRIPEATEQFEQALRINPDQSEICNNLGSIYGRQGRIADAIAQFQQAVKLNPSYGPAHTNLAYALVQAGRTAEAVAEYQQALRLDPTDARARSELIRLQALPPGK